MSLPPDLRSNQTKKAMRKIVLTFGGIAGAIVAFFMFATLPFRHSIEEGGALWVGYTTMVIALSMIFFGIKSYRDNHSMGSITFGKGLQVGLLIALIAAVMYAISWEFYFNLLAPNFMEEYAATAIQKAKVSGMGESELKKMMSSYDEMKEMYKNPILRFGMTLAEILPVGIAISLISAGLLRRREILPA